jgi:hypothetical protein
MYSFVPFSFYTERKIMTVSRRKLTTDEHKIKKKDKEKGKKLKEETKFYFDTGQEVILVWEYL